MCLQKLDKITFVDDHLHTKSFINLNVYITILKFNNYTLQTNLF